ncbi:hypothetical protein FIA58_000490 [Flavobacterium jejuense]|uniref:Uncharacterized protein n=1 Tax=Flavobacterium jejuense TaxID=1544455 RepID=A0ABX0IJY5_9FLAO|nr:hypothetical protein [Flavobacterium jejuense]NHN24140.1 hypothetical protein [Flavobacterium jejuense]
MKNIVFIVITFILFKPVFPVLDYLINYDYISTQLCENTLKPELKCNGKCHLKKELANEAKKENPNSNEHKNNSITFEVLYCENISSFIFNPIVYIDKKVQPLYNCIYFRLNSTSIFHPPILA